MASSLSSSSSSSSSRWERTQVIEALKVAKRRVKREHCCSSICHIVVNFFTGVEKPPSLSEIIRNSHGLGNLSDPEGFSRVRPDLESNKAAVLAKVGLRRSWVVKDSWGCYPDKGAWVYHVLGTEVSWGDVWEVQNKRRQDIPPHIISKTELERLI